MSELDGSLCYPIPRLGLATYSIGVWAGCNQPTNRPPQPKKSAFSATPPPPAPTLSLSVLLALKYSPVSSPNQCQNYVPAEFENWAELKCAELRSLEIRPHSSHRYRTQQSQLPVRRAECEQNLLVLSTQTGAHRFTTP